MPCAFRYSMVPVKNRGKYHRGNGDRDDGMMRGTGFGCNRGQRDRGAGIWRCLIVPLLLLVLTACTVGQKREVGQVAVAAGQSDASSRTMTPPAAVPSSRAVMAPSSSTVVRPANPSAGVGKIAELYPARGKGVDLSAAGAERTGAGRGDISLNFDNSDLREVAQIVLRDLLGVNYVIDPDVQGVLTLHTGRPVNRAALLPILEQALAANGAVLVKSGAIYRISKKAAASGAMPTAGTVAGGGIGVFPLDYLGAAEMAKIVKPLLPPGRLLQVDAAHNLLIVGGNAREMEIVSRTIAIFDVNQLAGQSVLLESLKNADVTTLVFELENVFGGGKGGPLSGLVRFIPIERMNAVLVISKQPEYLQEARNWIARLDRTRRVGERRLYVYYAQNGKASTIAKTLQGVFSGDDSPLGPVSVDTARQAAVKDVLEAGKREAQASSSAPRPVRIIADEVNNAVLTLATPRQYRAIEEVLKKLDLVPLQVLIEATIAEVSLKDELRFGVQYFLNNGGLGNAASGGFAALSTGSSSLLNSTFPGFSFVLQNADGQAKFILDTLSSLTELNVISSPHLMVLDNQTARLQVGDRVPVITQRSQSTTVANAPVINSVEYRDTGVTLDVTPRVNASGLVTLEITQEVSDVVATTTSQIDSPTFRQRKILSTVAVRSGETIVLGGLIRKSDDKGDAGIPVLHQLPLIGNVFGGRSSTVKRTELLVMITPRVVRSQREVRDLTLQLRQKFQAVLTLQEQGVEEPGKPLYPFE